MDTVKQIEKWRLKLEGKYKVGDLWKLSVPSSTTAIFRIIQIDNKGITSECILSNGNWEIGMHSFDRWDMIPLFFEDASKYRYLNSPLYKVMNE